METPFPFATVERIEAIREGVVSATGCGGEGKKGGGSGIGPGGGGEPA